MQDLEIGDDAFDRDFILKSNQESKLRVPSVSKRA